MLRQKLSIIAAAASVCLAVGALTFLAWWPDFYQVTEIRDGGEVRQLSESLLEHEGISVLWLLFLPVGFATAGFVASLRSTLSGKIGVWLAALALAGFSFILSLSIGAFYYPAALLLFLGAVAHPHDTKRPAGR